MQDEATYVCDACGEEIVVPLDVSAGESQEYVEDCPVCCRANVIHVEIEENGTARVPCQILCRAARHNILKFLREFSPFSRAGI